MGHTNDARSELQELETVDAGWRLEKSGLIPWDFSGDLDTIKNGWFTIGNPYENWMILGAFPYFGKHPYLP